jgi:hypothetical protein
MEHLDNAHAILPSPLNRLVERWWEDHFPGSAVARDTAAWNVAHAAKETLKRLLAELQNVPQAAIGDKDLEGSI